MPKSKQIQNKKLENIRDVSNTLIQNMLKNYTICKSEKDTTDKYKIIDKDGETIEVNIKWDFDEDLQFLTLTLFHSDDVGGSSYYLEEVDTIELDIKNLKSLFGMDFNYEKYKKTIENIFGEAFIGYNAVQDNYYEGNFSFFLVNFLNIVFDKYGDIDMNFFRCNPSVDSNYKDTVNRIQKNVNSMFVKSLITNKLLDKDLIWKELVSGFEYKTSNVTFKPFINKDVFYKHISKESFMALFSQGHNNNLRKLLGMSMNGVTNNPATKKFFNDIEKGDFESAYKELVRKCPSFKKGIDLLKKFSNSKDVVVKLNKQEWDNQMLKGKDLLETLIRIEKEYIRVLANENGEVTSAIRNNFANFIEWVYNKILENISAPAIGSNPILLQIITMQFLSQLTTDMPILKTNKKKKDMTFNIIKLAGDFYGILKMLEIDGLYDFNNYDFTVDAPNKETPKENLSSELVLYMLKFLYDLSNIKMLNNVGLSNIDNSIKVHKAYIEEFLDNSNLSDFDEKSLSAIKLYYYLTGDYERVKDINKIIGTSESFVEVDKFIENLDNEFIETENKSVKLLSAIVPFVKGNYAKGIEMITNNLYQAI